MKKEAKFEKKEEVKSRKTKITHRFITALSIVSILEFAAVVSSTLFSFDLNNYSEAFLMIIVGGGLIMEAKLKSFQSLSKGLNKNNFTHLTTVIIGLIALIAGVFSFPPIRIEAPGFLAIKGIIAIIAIIVIIIQTWIVD